MNEPINKLPAVTCSHEAQKGIRRFYLYIVSATGAGQVGGGGSVLIPTDVDNKKPLR